MTMTKVNKTFLNKNTFKKKRTPLTLVDCPNL